MLSMCISAQHNVLFIICRFSCQASQPVVCHQGTNAYTYQLKSLLSIDLGLYLRLNKDLFSKCHYSFCSDDIYIIKMSKQWANDSSIRIMGKGTSTVQSCIQLPIFEDCFTGQCLLLKRSTLCSQCASWLRTMFYLSLNCHIKQPLTDVEY